MSALLVSRRHLPWAVAAVLTSLCAVLYRFPPETFAFYPVCPFYQVTGLLCPGCGSTRALAALLHGHLRQAIGFNPFLVLIVLPSLVAYLGASLRRRQWLPLRTPLIASAAVLTVLFFITRNMP